MRLKRGLYTFGAKYLRRQLNPFVLAQVLYSPSYVSLESALAYYGLIPEAAYSVSSICTRRKARFDTPVSVFEYFTVSRDAFAAGVIRIEEENISFFIASPQKALLDYAYVQKKNWKDLADLRADLRLDESFLSTLALSELEPLAVLYHSKRLYSLITKLLVS